MTKSHPLGRLGAVIGALFIGLSALFLVSPPAGAAAAPPDAATVIGAWKTNPLFTLSGSPLTSAQQSEISTTLDDAKYPIYAVALPEGTVTRANVAQFIPGLLTQLDKEGRSAATVAVIDGTTLFAGTTAFPQRAVATMANESASAHVENPVAVMQEFTNRVEMYLGGNRTAPLKPGDTISGNGGVWATLGVIAVVGGGGIWLIARRNKRRREEKEAAELKAVKQTVEEDVTKFGEEITSLDLDAKMLPAAGTDHDWQHALDSYEKAKVQLTQVRRADELRDVTATLEDGRYALAVVKAKVNQLPLPERLPPCFFNPQHGPSVRNVRWAPPGGALRDVPACAMDADAIERGFDPQMREVVLPNGQRAPYWAAGPAYQPYANGYYGGFDGLLTGMLVGTMLGSAFGGFGYGGYGAGYADGVAADGGGDFGGDFGGGGGDFGGGGDWGGGDFGGGDFGGGDW
ncbi:hypothetical protein [Herbidospora cretacea]|uniref:hypothetical protein n=1 Tax=Herbidospora cretacea TaxID=28444 RepID=UPI000774AEB8|nr:hypothetical protein [Herbidospora cretacea]